MESLLTKTSEMKPNKSQKKEHDWQRRQEKKPKRQEQRQNAQLKKNDLKQNVWLKKKEKRRKPKRQRKQKTQRRQKTRLKKKQHKSKYGFSKKYGEIINSLEIRKHHICIIYPLQNQQLLPYTNYISHSTEKGTASINITKCYTSTISHSYSKASQSTDFIITHARTSYSHQSS